MLLVSFSGRLSLLVSDSGGDALLGTWLYYVWLFTSLMWFSSGISNISFF